MTDKIIDIEIYGQKYRIKVKGDEDEKYIGRLTSYVDRKMREIGDKSRSVDPFKIAVLAALNIADDYLLSRQQLDQLNDIIGQMEGEIESLEAQLTQHDSAYSKREKVSS
jgi:cell division protein ZapA